MKILSARIDWHHRYANSPTLQIKVDLLPLNHSLIYHRQPDGMTYTVIDGVLCPYIYMGAQGAKGRGFGGAEFVRKLDDGTEWRSADCWSGRAELLEIPCQEVIVYEADGKYPDFGYAGYGLIKDTYEQIIKALGAYMVNGKISCTPDIMEKPVEEPALWVSVCHTIGETPQCII